MRGVLDMAVIWMGLDFMLGCVDRDVLRESAWPVAVFLCWHRIGGAGLWRRMIAAVVGWDVALD